VDEHSQNLAIQKESTPKTDRRDGTCLNSNSEERIAFSNKRHNLAEQLALYCACPIERQWEYSEHVGMSEEALQALKIDVWLLYNTILSQPVIFHPYYNQIITSHSLPTSP
jgi:hypothetical protein